MKDNSRAKRRRHLARMKAKAKKVYPEYDKAITLANHLANCQCDGCQNPHDYDCRQTEKQSAWKQIDKDYGGT